MGCSAENHGNTPWRYAWISHSGVSAPPTASSPLGSVSARDVGGRDAGGSVFWSQAIPDIGFEPSRDVGAPEGQVGRGLAQPFAAARPLAGQPVADGGGKARSRISCTDHTGVGRKPRRSLCSPCVPGSKRARPSRMQYSMPR